ncbi:MAG: polyprenyl synthetase family protein [Hyphomicrobiaceae bacterium]|nr:polyprenyl synthetase family protein [Hyphomicrobiaceae bacterium]
MSFAQTLAHRAEQIDAELANLFVAGPAAATPSRLREAMRHALLGGGKRLRPFLVIESAYLFGAGAPEAAASAAAIECIHSYSLAHDDLPSMDNDATRRGHPTVWKAFDEWTAILAGDGLLTLAFEILADPSAHPDPAVRASLSLLLARASGSAGMVGGQALDLAWEKLDSTSPATADQVRELQSMKTGALITCACEMGAVIGGADDEARRALRTYGNALGFAFQIADDLLDAEGDSSKTGKAVAKDKALGKATLVELWGPGRCRDLLAELQNDCRAALAPFGDKATTLIATAEFVATRDR